MVCLVGILIVSPFGIFFADGGNAPDAVSPSAAVAQLNRCLLYTSIPGNSDTILYLGGNEASTHKYISEALGKATIDTRTHGQTKGRSGSYSTNFQMSGRELLTPDEVRGLDNRYAILFIRGARPVMDLKYELTQHPAIRHTVDGGGPPYIHKGKQAPAFTGTPLFQAFSAEELNESEENAA